MNINIRKSLNVENRRLLRPTKIVIVISAIFFVTILLLGRIINVSFVSSRLNNFTTQYRLILPTTEAAKEGDAFTERQRHIREIEEKVSAASSQFSDYRLYRAESLQLHQKQTDTVVNVLVESSSANPELIPFNLQEGKWPSQDDEITIPKVLAEYYNIKLGDEVMLGYGINDKILTYRVSGLTNAEQNKFEYSGFIVNNFDKFAELTENQIPLNEPRYLYFNPSTNFDKNTLIKQFPGADLQNLGQATTEEFKNFFGEKTFINPTTAMGIVFALLAVVISCMVIANTFQVLVAQQRKTFALLRAISASRRQIYRLVLIEGLRLGFIYSTIGAVIPWLAVFALGHFMPQFSGSALPQYLISPILILTLATTLSVMGAARSTNSVRPVEALQPLELAVKPQKIKKIGKGLLIFVLISLTLVILDYVHIYLYDFSALSTSEHAGISDSQQVSIMGIRFVGGLVVSFMLFIGIAVSTRYWLPQILKIVGQWFERRNPSAALASANIQLNPRRTGVTGTALIIGITLLTTMVTGSTLVSKTFNQFVDKLLPFDIEITDNRQEAKNKVDHLLRDNKGLIIDSAKIERTEMKVSAVDNGQPEDGAQEHVPTLSVAAADPSELNKILHFTFPDMSPDTIYFGENTYRSIQNYYAPNLKPGDELVLHYGGYNSDLYSVKVKTVLDPKLNNFERFYGDRVWTLFSTVKGAEKDVNHSWWFKVDDKEQSVKLIELSDQMNRDFEYLTGGLLLRLKVTRVLFIISLVLGSLILVSLLIALIGVSNNMILSVIQRREEIASLRIIGMTKQQLRRSLLYESLLICMVTIVVGLLLGLFFGTFGYQIIFGQLLGRMKLAFNLWLIPASLLIGVLSAWLASVAPTRRALGLSPIEALQDV